LQFKLYASITSTSQCVITHIESEIKRSIVIKMEKSVMCNVGCMLFSTQWRELYQFGTTTKHTCGWEIVERKL